MVKGRAAESTDVSDTIQSVESAHAGNGWPLLISLLILAAIPLLAFFLALPPQPKSKDVSIDEFSALRAFDFLKDLVSDGIPHPAGSQQNKVVRKKIVAMLESFGYDVSLQETEAAIRKTRTQADPDTIPLCNILARIDGARDGPGIMLVTHFDSVPYGPGASDDGVGVAAMLEVARMLKEQSAPKRPVILLFTDGEEYGLLGAKKFVEQHAWAGDVGWVINLEARGTKGPSIMFETGPESLSLVREFAGLSRRPVASSLFFEIYKQLPNDTDFTVFKNYGIEGYNFAFIGDVKNYHTPDDNLAEVNLSSFQHHGENMWRLVSRLAYLDQMPTPQGRAVYFDLFGRLLCWWPASWSIWLTGLGGLFWIGSIVLNLQRREVSLLSLLGSTGCVLLLVSVVFGASWLCDFTLRRDGRFDDLWPEYPLPLILSFWFSGLLMAAALALFLQRAATPQSHWSVVWLLWLAFSFLSSVYVTGASYLFIVPVLLAVLVQFVLVGLARISFGWGGMLSLLAAGVVWLPLELLFYDAVGFRLNLVLLVRVTLLMTVLWPLLCWTRIVVLWRLLAISAVLLIGCLAGSVLLPMFS